MRGGRACAGEHEAPPNHRDADESGHQRDHDHRNDHRVGDPGSLVEREAREARRRRERRSAARDLKHHADQQRVDSQRGHKRSNAEPRDRDPAHQP